MRRWISIAVAGVAETFVLSPITLLEDVHPAIRDGQLGNYQTRIALLQELWRHFVFGIVLGVLTPKRE